MAGLIYTANIGGYDSPKAIHVREEGIDYQTFTDGESTSTNPLFDARNIKVMTPHIVPGYDWYLWLDATMQIKAPLMPLIEKLLASPHDFAAFKHNEWSCSYKEIQACIERKKDDPYKLLRARALLEREKLPKNFGQLASGILWRRNTDAVREHAGNWWRDMQAFTMRDQATFMLNLWKQKIYIEWIPGSHLKNKWIKYHMGHSK